MVRTMDTSVFTPQAAVRAYVADIADGDAQAANALVLPSAIQEKSMVTAAALKASSAKMTDTSETVESLNAGTATVKVEFEVGKKHGSKTLTVIRKGMTGGLFNHWIVQTSMLSAIKVGNIPVIGTFGDTFAGVQFTVSGLRSKDVWVYPAEYQLKPHRTPYFTSRTKNYTVTGPGSVALSYTPTSKLRPWITAQVDAAVNECAAQTSTTPGCGVALPPQNAGATVSWTVGAMPDIQFSSDSMFFSTPGVDGLPYPGYLNGSWTFDGTLINSPSELSVRGSLIPRATGAPHLHITWDPNDTDSGWGPTP